MGRKNFGNPARPTAFGEPGAKQSQDKKPCRVMAKSPVRTVSVDYGLWSHLSLRSRRGTRISATWPLLARVNLPPSIPARPFGLGWRFDRTPLVAPVSLRRVSRQRLTHPRNIPSLAQNDTNCNNQSRRPA
jgi:hypothetical protein